MSDCIHINERIRMMSVNVQKQLYTDKNLA